MPLKTSQKISSVERACRFEGWEPKQKANRAARSNFPDIISTGSAVGLLGPADVRFYSSVGYEQDQITTVERVYFPNYITLKNDLTTCGYGGVNVVNEDIFVYLSTVKDGSISALFLDLFGFADLCSNSKTKSRNANLELVCSKLADNFHLQFTYENQRSAPLWQQRAKEALIDQDRSVYVLRVCKKLLEKRGIEVDNGITCEYSGLLSDGRPQRMITSSFVGHKAN
jgi:hypothetical protein